MHTSASAVDSNIMPGSPSAVHTNTMIPSVHSMITNVISTTSEGVPIMYASPGIPIVFHSTTTPGFQMSYNYVGNYTTPNTGENFTNE